MTIAGALSAKATGSGDTTGAVTADATVTLPGARLRVPMGEEVRDLDLSKGSVTARVDGKGARGEARLFLGDLASVDAKADLPGWTPRADPAKQRLSGSLKARVPDLAFVKAFAPDLGAVSGQVALDLGLDGTLAQPRAKGQGGLYERSGRGAGRGTGSAFSSSLKMNGTCSMYPPLSAWSPTAAAGFTNTAPG